MLQRLIEFLPGFGYRRAIRRRIDALRREQCSPLCPRHGDVRDTSVRNPRAERCSEVAA